MKQRTGNLLKVLAIAAGALAATHGYAEGLMLPFVAMNTGAAGALTDGEGGGGTGGAGAGGAGAGAGSGGGDGGAGAGTGGASGEGAAVDVAWLGSEGVTPELKGYAQNKGWKNPMQLLDGYRNLEKLVGENRIAVPKDEKDEAAWSKFYDTLGRPKAPAEYKLPVPQGADPKFAESISAVFHKAGMSTRQATAVATAWNEMQAQAAKDAQVARETAQVKGMEAVKSAWGGAFSERTETAKRGLRTFGIDGEMASKLEDALGTQGLMNFAWRLGHATGEHKAAGIDDGGKQSGALTPDQAKAEIARLKADPEFGKKYTNKDAAAAARMEQLHKWAFPE